MKKKYNIIINDIQKVRSKNNKNWMDILRLAYKHSPKEAAKILSEIYKEDRKISILAKKLTKNE
jgi:hypothetical protein